MKDSSRKANAAPDSSSMKRFFVVWGGQAFSLLGSNLVQFALVWWITKTTGSATYLAIAAMAAIVPQIVVSPFAGALVDRWDRRKVMIAADSGIAAVTGVLAMLFYLGAADVWMVCALLAVRAAGGSFHWPAMQASTTLMVPEEHLSRIGGLNQALHGAGNIGAPPLGALLLEVLPMAGVLAVDIVTAVIAVSTLLAVRIPNPVRNSRSDAKRHSLVSEIGECIGFIKSWPGLPTLLLMFMIMNFIFAPADALLPLLTVNRFGGGVIEFASLQSAFGVGMLVGGLVLGVWGGFRKRVLTMMSTLFVGGISIAAVGMAPPDGIMIAISFVFIIGSMLAMANGATMALLQAKVPPEMQGRMFTIIGMICMAMMPVGLSLAGPVADIVGVHSWFVISGATIALAALLATMHPRVMDIESYSKIVAQDTECSD